MDNLTDIFISSKKTLKERLLRRISTYDIYCRLIGSTIDVGQVILSPIRRDSRPTFTLFVPEGSDEVFFKDFAWVGGNVFKFIKLHALYKEGIVLRYQSDSIRYIAKKFDLDLYSYDGVTESSKELPASFYTSKSVINFKSRDYTERDLLFWNKYFITSEILILFDIRSIHMLLTESGQVLYTASTNTLIFAFVIYNKVKLYRPEDKSEFKWRNTCPAHYYQGLQQLIKADTGNKKLIITKAMKDVMVFYAFLHDSFDVIAPHGESYIPEDDFLEFLFSRYDEIFIVYDFDRAGVAGANRLRKRSKKFKVVFVSTRRIHVNGVFKTIDKDISDYAEFRSYSQVNQHLNNIFYE